MGPTGPLNALTDVPGLTVGHADDGALASGVTAVLFERPAVAGVVVAGGAPAGRDQECLEPDRTVGGIDAIVLSGGSSFGLEAAGGAQAWLRERGRGLPVGVGRVPIVPAAILFDLGNGGDKDWGRYPPYRELGYAACETAGRTVALGTVGGGYGATTKGLKGGVGSCSAVGPRSGHVVGALAICNAIGSAVVGEGPHFWAAPWEEAGEFGGLGSPRYVSSQMRALRWKGESEPGTTIAVVATDAALTKAQAKRLATAAQGGLPRALRLSHAPMDGDTVFAAATGSAPLRGPDALTEICALAADCLARSIARGVFAATALPFPGALPAWRDRFGR